MKEEEKDGSGGSGGSWWVLAVVLSLLCLLVRMQGLMGLPLFGDEAIYLRWAQLVRAGHGWVSLVDPKPPLHFWLMALVFDWAGDPLRAARLLSVLAGVLSVPAMMGACSEIARLGRETGEYVVSGRVLGVIGAVLLIFCPFVSFYQRLGTADALFVLEMLVVVWLGLWWGRSWGDPKRGWFLALALGFVMGLALMTRQGLSYTLWGVVVGAFAISLARGKRERIWKGLVQLVMMVVIAGVIWVPYLAAELPAYAENWSVSEGAVVKRRILYQDQFTQGGEGRIGIALRNGFKTFLPAWFEAQEAGPREEMGWLWGYLTWPVYGVCVAGLIWLGVRRQWWVLGFLLWWMALMWGPVVVLGNVVYSRYVLAGAVGFLVAGAWMAADVLRVVLGWRGGWAVAILLVVGLLAMPIREIGVQVTRWWEQTLTSQDRYQYVTGWSAGAAVRKAIRSVEDAARAGKVVVITDDGWGLPADALWVYLSGMANVEVYYTSVSGTGAILLPGDEPGSYLLRKDKYLYTPAEPVKIEKETQVFFVTWVRAGDAGEMEKRLRYLNPAPHEIGEKILFSGIVGSEDKVVRFSVK